ncbi:hypothetical protein GE21DRAFT_1217788 [Neurospora crassa]|nr:hypothetical protein GE21DRAFT_1217788 [Neurospora crassa]
MSENQKKKTATVLSKKRKTMSTPAFIPQGVEYPHVAPHAPALAFTQSLL